LSANTFNEAFGIVILHDTSILNSRGVTGQLHVPSSSTITKESEVTLSPKMRSVKWYRLRLLILPKGLTI